MSVRKMSVAIEEDVAEAASASARRQGLSLSAWLAAAARARLTIEDGLGAVAEWEAVHGKLTETELREADRILDSQPARPLRRGRLRSGARRAKRAEVA